MLFDCFPFLNEVELLELRFMELGDLVDYFVVVEADKTHSGRPKPFNFDLARYQPWQAKIIYVRVTDLPDASPEQPWLAENFQRNAIMRALERLARPGDQIMVSDADEIPNPRAIMECLQRPTTTILKQRLYYYYVNNQARRNWGGTAIATYGTFRCPQDLRCSAMRHGVGTYPPNDPYGGWHYSYFGDIWYKLESIVDGYGYKFDRDEVLANAAARREPLNRPQKYMQTRIADITDTKPQALDAWLVKYPQFFYREMGA
jgi:beta-1,4-mannosyl-glycoprotein beta-1,4-N-acetylglucosaminyltransferase